MTRKRITVLVLWGLSLIIVSAYAQAQRGTPPAIISGNDLGFRVDRQIGNQISGTLVVRINGEWIVPGGGVKALADGLVARSK